MHRFNRASRPNSLAGADIEQRRALHDQKRPQTLSPLQTIGHRFDHF